MGKLSFHIILIIFALLILNYFPVRTKTFNNSIYEEDEKESENEESESELEKFKIIENRYKAHHQYQPRHVHISYGDKEGEMFITWSTISNTFNSSFVEYGVQSFDEKRVKAVITKFENGGPMKLVQYIHRVKLTNLASGQQYVYHCGSAEGWSDVFSFKAMKKGTEWSPHLAIYGDLGSENAQSLTRLQRETQLGTYDAIIHVGDFAYNMNSHDGIVGDTFMEQIEPIAAYVPYMTCQGNHENFMNFTHYKNRFTMPGNSESQFYSWNIGPIHFVAFSTEFYFFLKYGIKPLVNQYQWLEADIIEASKPENRNLRPWIITYAHRPMYCSNKHKRDCEDYSRVRVGIPALGSFGLEDLFRKYKVDLSIWAHEHSYERLWPMYNLTVLNGSYAEPYTNPRALVHLITGSAGCKEKHAYFPKFKPEWSAYRNTDYGYTKLKVFNKTHLYIEQISDDKNGQVVDNFYLIKDKRET